MTLLDDVKLIRDQITSSYQEAYDALQEANISMGLITDIVNSTPEDYGISINCKNDKIYYLGDFFY